MKHIWACECGHETEVEPEVFESGSTFRCPKCRQWWGCVHSIGRGSKVWVRIDTNIALFYDLSGEKAERWRLEEEAEEKKNATHT